MAALASPLRERPACGMAVEWLDTDYSVALVNLAGRFVISALHEANAARGPADTDRDCCYG